jgi:tRNA threonylcarbamoyladenosine biosynthesis protein TsaE
MRTETTGAHVETREVASADEMLALGEEIARRLPGGSVVHLHGDLGVGKTVFAKGLARGLGLDPDDVLSPTFTLVHPHAPARDGALGFVHVDLYRIARAVEAEELALTELPGPNAIAAVEWAERLAETVAPGFVSVAIRETGATTRTVLIAWPPAGALPPGRVT